MEYVLEMKDISKTFPGREGAWIMCSFRLSPARFTR